MNPVIKLSIVVGVQHAQENVAQIVHAIAPALHPEVELLFCHTAADPDVPALVGAQGHVRVIPGPAGSLIPHLWRDGILAARGERVATTTAHCIPAAAWVDALIAADLDNAANRVLWGNSEGRRLPRLGPVGQSFGALQN